MQKSVVTSGVDSGQRNFIRFSHHSTEVSRSGPPMHCEIEVVTWLNGRYKASDSAVGGPLRAGHVGPSWCDVPPPEWPRSPRRPSTYVPGRVPTRARATCTAEWCSLPAVIDARPAHVDLFTIDARRLSQVHLLLLSRTVLDKIHWMFNY